MRCPSISPVLAHAAVSIATPMAIATFMVEAELNQRFPEAEVIIHQDPAGLDEEHPTFR